MSELVTRVVELPSMRIASAIGYGKEPEGLAIEKLLAWARTRGLLAPSKQKRFFGFNNPNPSAGSPNYGYEFWITVEPEIETDGEIAVKQFGGGLYIVTHANSVEEIVSKWQKLVTWLETSPYKLGQHQWLEETLFSADYDPMTASFDLYMPVMKAEG